jgi:hypothetical protein
VTGEEVDPTGAPEATSAPGDPEDRDEPAEG